MFDFNLKTTAIYQTLKWEKIFKLVGIFKKLFLLLFIIFLFLFLTSNLSIDLAGIALLFFIFFLISWLKETFFNLKIKNPQIKYPLVQVLKNPENYNLAEFLSFESAEACFQSLKLARTRKISPINSTLIFYYLLVNNPKLNFVFSRILLNKEEVGEIIKKQLENLFSKKSTKPFQINFSADFQKVILGALKIAQKKGRLKIGIGDILVAISQHNPIFQKILIEKGLKSSDIENLVLWQETLEKKISQAKKFWEYNNLLKKGTLAKEWAAGYTLFLDQYSIDWSKIIQRQGFPEIIGHKRELEQIERILARQEINNVLLVGEPGTGRKSIISALTSKSLKGQSLSEVNFKRIVELDLPLLLSQIENFEEVEVILNKIFQEVIEAQNVILIIDEFHNFVGGKERPGVIDISGILASFLRLPQFQIIAITTYAGLHRYIEQNPSILGLFETVEVLEISPEETLSLLEKNALYLENKHKVFVTYPGLRQVIEDTSRYLPNLTFPKKALDILDESLIYVKTSKKEKILLAEDVDRVISEKTGIPLGEMEVKERKILLNLENLIHKRIINQDEAVKEVSAALRRARAEVTVRNGPMGCFLFLGPTGVGKTETSKALAEIYFGSETRMIRLDMSEFQAIEDIPRLIGSPGQEGLLTTPVRENPFSLILLDEIEKAHKNVLNLFLQVLDEGHLTDGLGRKVSFKNTIIIATSNAGYQVILEALREKAFWPEVKEKLLSYLFQKAIFRPEFINRFDAVVVFSPLSKENFLDISQLMLERLKNNLKERGIEFLITPSLKEKIVELGYSPIFGARELRRVIQDKVENVLARALLEEKLKRGDRIEIDPLSFEISKK